MSVDDDIQIREDAAQVRRFVEAQTLEEQRRVFEAFVQRHQQRVHAYCITWTGDVDAALDAAQETFLAAWRRGLRQIKEPEAVRGWLRTTAKYQAIRQSSGASAKKAAVMPVADVGDVPQLAAMQQTRNEEQMNAAQRAGRVEAGKLLAEKVAATLPAAHQRMYDLRMRRQLAGAELGSELGVSPVKAAKLADKFRICLRNAVGATLLVQSGEGCDRLRAITAKAGPQGEVLEPDLRETAVRHISHCGTCKPRQAQLMMRYAPALVPLLYGAELRDRVMSEIRLAGGAGYTRSHAHDRKNSSAAANSSDGPRQLGASGAPAAAASPTAAEAGGILAPAGRQAAQALRQPAAFMATRFEQAKAACYVRLTSLVNFVPASPWGRVAAAVAVTAAVVLSPGQPPTAASGMPSLALVVPVPAVPSVRGPYAPITTVPDVLFQFKSVTLLPSADTILRPIAAKASNRHLLVSITGYASPDGGSAKSNTVLSQNRARAVQARLIALGLPPGQITGVTGLGTNGNTIQACDVAGKYDDALCAQMRRVVLVLSPSKARFGHG
jgi:DNA-directed RNA polymerase specialized sigma24 family protein/outer membrane protein OmpA-like peptidoglycan-associated protein